MISKGNCICKKVVASKISAGQAPYNPWIDLIQKIKSDKKVFKIFRLELDPDLAKNLIFHHSIIRLAIALVRGNQLN